MKQKIVALITATIILTNIILSDFGAVFAMGGCTLTDNCVYASGHTGRCLGSEQAEQYVPSDTPANTDFLNISDLSRQGGSVQVFSRQAGEASELSRRQEDMINRQKVTMLTNQTELPTTVPESRISGTVPSITPEILNRHVFSDTVEHSGTKIDLFDYWLSDYPASRFMQDYKQSDIHNADLLKRGINGHMPGMGDGSTAILKFYQGLDSAPDNDTYKKYKIAANVYSSANPTPARGIVKDLLGADGFPVLKNGSQGITEEQSLRYLFNVNLPDMGDLPIGYHNDDVTKPSGKYYDYIKGRKSFKDVRSAKAGQ